MATYKFSFETPYGNFSDAIVLPDNISYTDLEIESIKKERLAAWVAQFENKDEVQ